jgi:hypothetical protein
MTARDPNAKCRAKGCTDPVNALGWCKSHYDRRRLSDPERRAANTARARAWYYENREDQLVKMRAKYQAEKYDRAASARLKRFGLTQEGFDSLLVEQGGGCAICGSTKAGGRGGFAVDHCHETGRVRGLLCANCNNGLGRFKDDPVRLYAAIDYLKRSADPLSS